MADQNKSFSPSQPQPAEPLPWNYHLFEETNKPKKTSWPELVGVGAEEAIKKIKEDMPEAHIHMLLPPTYVMQQDFDPNRVWLLVDGSHKVWKTPSIG